MQQTWKHDLVKLSNDKKSVMFMSVSIQQRY